MLFEAPRQIKYVTGAMPFKERSSNTDGNYYNESMNNKMYSSTYLYSNALHNNCNKFLQVENN